jgi:hypothetical protein
VGASADADDGSVQVTEAVLGDVGGYLRAEVAELPSCAMTSRPVFATDPAIRSVSSGARVHGSTISTLMPRSPACGRSNGVRHERVESNHPHITRGAKVPAIVRVRSA